MYLQLKLKWIFVTNTKKNVTEVDLLRYGPKLDFLVETASEVDFSGKLKVDIQKLIFKILNMVY